MAHWPIGTVTALAERLDKRNLVDLLERGHSRPYFVERRFAQEAHAFMARAATDFRGWLLGQNHLADAVGQIQKFMNRRPPFESGARALDASLAFIERNLSPLRRIEAAGFEHIGGIMHRGVAGHAAR